MHTDYDVRFAVDTALGWDGDFPPCDGDLIVGIHGPYGYELVLVSARYTKPDADEAATIAVDAYHEREGHEVPWTAAFGGPFYHVDIWPASDDTDARRCTGIVRSEQDCILSAGWDYEPGSPAGWAQVGG